MSFRKLSESRYSALAIFLGLVVFAVVGLAILRPLGNWFIKSAPINYAYICEKHLSNGQPEKVLPIAQIWLKKHYYDFRAHYLEARAYEAMGQYTQATEVMKMVLQKLPAARARNLPLAGFDEAKTYDLLSKLLWKEGKYSEAAELARLGVDEGNPDFVQELLSKENRRILTDSKPEALLAATSVALKTEQTTVAEELLGAIKTQDPYLLSRKAILMSSVFEKKNDKIRAEETLSDAVLNFPAIPGSKLALANFCEREGRTSQALELAKLAEQTTGVKLIGPGMFERKTGFEPVGSTGVELSRNGEYTAGQLSTGAFRVCTLLLNGTGVPALGVYPVVVVKADGVEMTRIYMDSPDSPKIFESRLWPEGASKKLDFTLEFVNDVWDPYTKADRNIVIKNILLY